MSSSSRSLWLSRFAALVLAGAAVGSLVAWGLKLRAPQEQLTMPEAVVTPVQVDAGVLSRALGGAATNGEPLPSAALAGSRMSLVGVLAHTGNGGAALIAVDGKAPKPVPVGAPVGDGWVLASVAPRRAVLRSAAGGGDALLLEMPVTPALVPKTANSP